MGIFKRMKDGIGAKANAALDKAIDPAKELEIAIAELENGRKKALQELVSYKTTAKQMEQDLQKAEARAAEWEKRAMVAVKAGNDDMAREALREKKAALVELEKIKRDRDEAASYAIQLNRSRKEFDTKLQMLKMRKGTMAVQLQAARSGGGVLGTNSELFDKFQRAEERIDAEAIAAEVHAAMEGEELSTADFDAKLRAAGGDPSSGAEDALSALKQKMALAKSEREQKQLGAAPPAAAGEPEKK
jgi:phage shock protein A